MRGSLLDLCKHVDIALEYKTTWNLSTTWRQMILQCRVTYYEYKIQNQEVSSNLKIFVTLLAK
jgi:hypothetical protein